VADSVEPKIIKLLTYMASTGSKCTFKASVTHTGSE